LQTTCTERLSRQVSLFGLELEKKASRKRKYFSMFSDHALAFHEGFSRDERVELLSLGLISVLDSSSFFVSQDGLEYEEEETRYLDYEDGDEENEALVVPLKDFVKDRSSVANKFNGMFKGILDLMLVPAPKSVYMVPFFRVDFCENLHDDFMSFVGMPDSFDSALGRFIERAAPLVNIDPLSMRDAFVLSTAGHISAMKGHSDFEFEQAKNREPQTLTELQALSMLGATSYKTKMCVECLTNIIARKDFVPALQRYYNFFMRNVIIIHHNNLVSDSAWKLSTFPAAAAEYLGIDLETSFHRAIIYIIVMAAFHSTNIGVHMYERPQERVSSFSTIDIFSDSFVFRLI
jgi:hypothetical protein